MNNFTMNTLSWIILICFAVFLLIGFARGFLKIALGHLKLAVYLLVSYFLARPTGLLIYSSVIGTKLSEKYASLLLQTGDVFGKVLTAENQAEVVSEGLGLLKIPNFMHNTISRMIGNIAERFDGLSLAEYTGQAFAKMTCIVLGFVILVVIVFIIMTIIFKQIKDINETAILGPINRILGAVVSASVFILVLSFAFWGLALVSTASTQLTDFVNKVFDLNGDMNLARWLYENNLAIKLFDLIMR